MDDYTTVEHRGSSGDLREYHQALWRAQQEVGSLGNDSRGNRGEYVSCEKMLDRCREVLHRNGLIVYPLRATLLEATCDATSIHGEVTPGTLIWERHFKLVHVPSGGWEILTQGFPVVISKRMPLDHATAATDSFGLTYFLRGLLNVVRGEEEDSQPQAPKSPATASKEVSRPVAPLGPPRIVREAARELGATVPRDHDPSIEELRAAWGVDVPSCEDLASVPAGEACAGAMVKDLHLAAVQVYSKEEVTSAWKQVGVELRKGQVITGREARQFVATLALSREPASSQKELS